MKRFAIVVEIDEAVPWESDPTVGLDVRYLCPQKTCVADVLRVQAAIIETAARAVAEMRQAVNEARRDAGCDSPERREQDQAIIADMQQCIGARIVRQFERPMTAEEQAQ